MATLQVLGTAYSDVARIIYANIPTADLAKLQTLWGDANVVNRIPGWIEAVTSADLQRVARTYLASSNRTVIDRVPEAMLAARQQE